MAISNLDFEQKENLAQSGSNVATDRNNIAFEAARKNPNTGFIYAPSKTQDYNIPALQKAIDTEITELIPVSEEEELNLVPRPLYEDALEALATAEETIEIQADTIATLEGRVSELEAQVEELSADLDNEQLLRVISEANSENLREQLALVNETSQTSLQRSILEGIQRAASDSKATGLEAEVNALKQEVISLEQEKDRFEKSLVGKEAQIEAGAKTNTDITVNVLEKQNDQSEDLTLDSIKVNAGDDGGRDGIWINGPSIEIYNFTAVKQTIKFDVSGATTPEGVWIKRIPDLSLNPNEKRVIKVATEGSVILSTRPRTRAQGAQSYRGKIIVSSNTGKVTLSTRLYKHKKR